MCHTKEHDAQRNIISNKMEQSNIRFNKVMSEKGMLLNINLSYR